MIRKKKFCRYLINQCYPIAIDGTGKLKRDWLWDEEYLERNVKKGPRTHAHSFELLIRASALILQCAC